MPEPSELWRRIARVGDEIDPRLSDRDVERLVAGAERLARRRAVTRRAAGMVAVGVAATAMGLVVSRGRGGSATDPQRATAPAAEPVVGALTGGAKRARAGDPSGGGRPPGALTTPTVPSAAAPATRPTPASSAARAVRLSDGSVATPLDDGTELTVRESAAQRVTIDLERGRGRFEVTPRADRIFSVRAGEVNVSVVGTVFTVERIADRVGVSVDRGRVLVDWGAGSRRLDSGESGWFPPLQIGAAAPIQASATTPVASRTTALAEKNPRPHPSSPSSSSSRSSPAPSRTVPAGRNVDSPARSSFAAVPAPPAFAPAPAPASEPTSVESYLAAADAARVDGRAADAAALLKRALEVHRSDPRAPLAAFTLGRVLLKELARPRDAAAAFAQARALAPEGPFAEDALGREVEAWSKAHDLDRARDRAGEYLRLYPQGRRAHALRAFGGRE